MTESSFVYRRSLTLMTYILSSPHRLRLHFLFIPIWRLCQHQDQKRGSPTWHTSPLNESELCHFPRIDWGTGTRPSKRRSWHCARHRKIPQNPLRALHHQNHSPLQEKNEPWLILYECTNEWLRETLVADPKIPNTINTTARHWTRPCVNFIPPNKLLQDSWQCSPSICSKSSKCRFLGLHTKTINVKNRM